MVWEKEDWYEILVILCSFPDTDLTIAKGRLSVMVMEPRRKLKKGLKYSSILVWWVVGVGGLGQEECILFSLTLLKVNLILYVCLEEKKGRKEREGERKINRSICHRGRLCGRLCWRETDHRWCEVYPGEEWVLVDWNSTKNFVTAYPTVIH